mmetsp:Transcript_36174/g.45057  ORF Transcript_36174/g.45057 Transcript_36174/m.45057 type:complete len:395 (-) Transcript_36174:3266-4450(-)
MRIITVVVNSPDEVTPAQTTAQIIRVAAERGYTVWVTGVGDLSCSVEGRVLGYVRQLTHTHYESYQTLVQDILSQGKKNTMQRPLNESDVVLMRTSPGRDKKRGPLHTSVLTLMRMVRDAGTPVLNDPDGLCRASSKLYLQELPASVKPLTLVSSRPKEIVSFIEGLNGKAVLKPLSGTRGRDVFMVRSAKDPNLLQIIDVILRQGLVMVQSFIPSALEGDTRVLVVNGEILKENGKVAAYRRIPNGSDFRSNLHAGGTTAGAVITPGMRKVVASVGPYLRRDGLFLVGLDFIGDKICEVNVHSPGGTRWASALTGVDFTNRLWDEIERHCANVKNTRSETFLSNKNQNQTENLVNININKRTAPTWANSFCSTRSRRGKRVKTSKPISANSLA